MSTAVANTDNQAMLGELTRVLVQGDLSQLTEPQKVQYYSQVCDSLGLNKLTQPFQFLILGTGKEKKLTMYATKNCTDQLRKIHGTSAQIVDRQIIDGIYIVTARTTAPDGRYVESTGAVSLEKEDGEWRDGRFERNGNYSQLRGEARANAFMKAETKAFRRGMLSLCGLGFPDESEIETIQGATPVQVRTVPQAETLTDSKPVSLLTRLTSVLSLMNCSFLDPKIRERISKIVGRKIYSEADLNTLTEVEENTLFTALRKAAQNMPKPPEGGSKTPDTKPEEPKPTPTTAATPPAPAVASTPAGFSTFNEEEAFIERMRKEADRHITPANPDNDEAPSLPANVAKALITAIVGCGKDWPSVRSELPDILGVRLTAEAKITELTLEEAQQLMGWLNNQRKPARQKQFA